uniref:Uncharacterized protein n=1 Tax=Arundo donax TaxID=35708 RepID=A0A0A8YIG0_ARUDO
MNVDRLRPCRNIVELADWHLSLLQRKDHVELLACVQTIPDS